MLKTLGCFELNMTVLLPVGGAWALRWNNEREPIGSAGGPGFPAFPGSVPGSGTSLSFDGRGGFRLAVSAGAGTSTLRSGTCVVAAGVALRLSLVQRESTASFVLAGCESAAGPVRVSGAANVRVAPGGMVVQKSSGGTLYVSEMNVRETTVGGCAAPPQQWVAMLPSEAMGACFNSGHGAWKPVQNNTAFRFGGGYVHPGGTDMWGYVGKQVAEVPMVKYNFVGPSAPSP